jgi:hypothetical protein
MQNFIHSVADFFAPKPVRRNVGYRTIEAVNDCGEKRYIQIPTMSSQDRRENLEVLITKCKRLMSFVTKKKWDEKMYDRISKLNDDVRMALYKNDDITPLFKEFESIENFFKGSSKSSMNLSGLDSM